MIKNFNGNIFNSNANFIVCGLDSQGTIENDDLPSHVERECLKYVRYCKKNHIEILGSVQYVPTEIWALNMVDTMKNNDVMDYDTSYQYIVNLFCKNVSDEGIKMNPSAVKEGLADILTKAEMIKATVAVPYKIGKYINEIINKYDVDVEVWR